MMDISTYEKFWTSSMKPKIDRMVFDDNDIFFIDGQVKEKIWMTYEEFKNKVHSYMHNPDGKIDRHKIASVMLYSIIANKPIELNLLSVKQGAKGSSLLANEILGFHSALSIVQSFIIEDANQNSDFNKIEIFKNGFLFPECQHDTYQMHMYKMLYYSKLNNRYDIFAFSHILFLIEAYTEYRRKIELTEVISRI